MNKFIKYTVGMESWVKGRLHLVKVEFSETPKGNVELSLVSGHNLGKLGINKAISREAFEDRPTQDNIDELRWALDILNLNLAAEEA